MRRICVWFLELLELLLMVLMMLMVFPVVFVESIADIVRNKDPEGEADEDADEEYT